MEELHKQLAELKRRAGPEAEGDAVKMFIHIAIWLNDSGHGTLELSAKDRRLAPHYKVVNINHLQ